MPAEHLFAAADRTDAGRRAALFTLVRELLFADRERIIAVVDDAYAAAVRALAAADQGRYRRSNHLNHLDNFRRLPGVANVIDGASVKTAEAQANLQLTVTSAIRDGAPVSLLDADMDENGTLLLHAFDLIKHKFNGGTHPLDIHEALRAKFPTVAIGYGLEPRVPVPEVEVRVVSPAASVVVPRCRRSLRRLVRSAASSSSATRCRGGRGCSRRRRCTPSWLAAFANGGALAATRLLAHSGAVIGAGATRTAPPVHGEVPAAYPSILDQCRSIAAAEAAAVDLVIVNGGVNDVDVRFIVNPITDANDLADTTARACGPDLTRLLREVAQRFPQARITVLEYYPILSRRSRFNGMADFLAAVGAPVNVAAVAAPGAVFPPIWDRIVENCRVFHVESTAAIRASVAAVNREFGNRVVAVDPGFREEHAALAPEAWLFGIDWDLSPQDAVAAERRAAFMP